MIHSKLALVSVPGETTQAQMCGSAVRGVCVSAIAQSIGWATIGVVDEHMMVHVRWRSNVLSHASVNISFRCIIGKDRRTGINPCYST